MLSDNTEFVVTYKCRVCGALVDKAHTGEGPAMAVLSVLDYHRCASGSLGLCDLQGMVIQVDPEILHVQNEHGDPLWMQNADKALFTINRNCPLDYPGIVQKILFAFFEAQSKNQLGEAPKGL